MRLPGRSPFLLGAIAFAAVVCAGFASAAVFADEDGKAETSEAVFRGALREMPWYDAPRDDYRRYDPAAVEREYVREPETRERAERPTGISPELLRLGVYVFLATILLGLVFLLLRAWRERSLAQRSRSIGRGVRKGLVLADVPESVLADESPLEDRIERALHTDPRLAAILIFVYALVVLLQKGVLADRPQWTAREVLRGVRDSAHGDARLQEFMAQTAAQFELCLFARRDPTIALEPLWTYWKETGASS